MVSLKSTIWTEIVFISPYIICSEMSSSDTLFGRELGTWLWPGDVQDRFDNSRLSTGLDYKEESSFRVEVHGYS